MAVRSGWLYEVGKQDADHDDQGVASGAEEPDTSLDHQQVLLFKLTPEGLASPL